MCIHCSVASVHRAGRERTSAAEQTRPKKAPGVFTSSSRDFDIVTSVSVALDLERIRDRRPHPCLWSFDFCQTSLQFPCRCPSLSWWWHGSGSECGECLWCSRTLSSLVVNRSFGCQESECRYNGDACICSSFFHLAFRTNLQLHDVLAPVMSFVLHFGATFNACPALGC